MKVLVADDDAVSLLILCRAVEKSGHEYLAARDGSEAWRLYEDTPDVDAVISDWMMPEMDGLELCRSIREQERDGYTYFIFLTALGGRDHLLEGFEAGADDYLTKPLDRAELEVRLISASRVTSLHRRLAEKNRQLESLNERLFEQSRKDPLTGLNNRLRLREDLEVLSARAERYGHSYCAILCDVDHFKLYNDTHGHLAGDEVLKTVARTLAGTVRRGDTVYRYGGEEFLALLPEQSIESSRRVAERLRETVEKLELPSGDHGGPVRLTISAGISVLSGGDAKSPDDLLREADDALYEAKESGRNRVVTYGGE